MIDFENKSFLKMKRNESYGEKVAELLVPGERVVDSYSSMRDGIVFTDKRIITLNVQGLTGKKRDYTSIPYSKISAYSIETSGALDLDAELEIWISGLGSVRFEFRARSAIVEISRHISQSAL